MSPRAARFAAAAAVAALAAAVLALLLPTPTVRPHGDRDKAADCWAHPDRHGRRHCAR